jgi:hypothetical protein
LTFLKILKSFYTLVGEVLKRYPVALDSPKINQAKMQTLEFFLTFPGWHTPDELLKDSELGGIYFEDPASKAVQMRLLRYWGMGLLKRRNRSRGYEYAITPKGEDRLFFLWRNGGYLDGKKEGLSEAEMKEMEERFIKIIATLKKRRKDINTKAT